LVAAAGLAGFIDAIAGGGGLVQLPALLVGLPVATPLPAVLGTNKLASCAGTTLALRQFVRARIVPHERLLLPIAMAMLGSAFGAQTSRLLDAACCGR
jgi:uncharacterized membrane protein YfcA